VCSRLIHTREQPTPAAGSVEKTGLLGPNGVVLVAKSFSVRAEEPSLWRRLEALLARNSTVPAVERATAEVARQPAQRLVSLDVFRGITIAAMILVNNPGSYQHVYRFLDHAVWNGCRPADLIFPFFLFIVGVAVTLSLGRHAARGAQRTAVLTSIARRTLILFALGVLLNGFPFFDWEIFRIPGILQRIALCYGAAALIALTTTVRQQVGITAALLLGYWALMTLVPVPGHGPGHLVPDENLAAFVDRTLMGGHLLHHDWDPEGLLSTLPALATTLIGVLTGRWLRAATTPSQRLTGLLVAGVVGMGLGELMGLRFPINKSLWTSSFAVFTAGAALISLGFCYWLIDIEGYNRWTTAFVVFGTNPIIAYFCSSLGAKALEFILVSLPDGSKVTLRHFVFEEMLRRLATPKTASLLYALATMLVWLAATALLYRKRIFIKV
jgi:predicted acyltransferase